MKKNTIWIIAGVVAVLLICCVGSTAAYYIYTRGVFTAPLPTPFTFPTPNATLTALYSIPTLSLPTATESYVAPTYPAAVTPTNTPAIPTAAGFNPSFTSTPVVMRGSGQVVGSYMLKPPVLDGTWDEWPATEFPINVVVYGLNNFNSTLDLYGSYKVGWDYSYLYLAVEVDDDKYTQVSSGSYLYMGDSLEILMDTNLIGDLTVKKLDGDDYQLGISPGLVTPGSGQEAYLWYPSSLAGGRSSVLIAAIGGNGIYHVELAIPWYVFNVAPYEGMELGFAMSISDDDLNGVARQQTMISSCSFRSLVDPTTWGTLTLK
jgi:hypothetical protein